MKNYIVSLLIVFAYLYMVISVSINNFDIVHWDMLSKGVICFLMIFFACVIIQPAIIEEKEQEEDKTEEEGIKCYKGKTLHLDDFTSKKIDRTKKGYEIRHVPDNSTLYVSWDEWTKFFKERNKNKDNE